MKNGDTVAVKTPVIQGIITKTEWDNSRDCKVHHVVWTNAESEENSRAFAEDELSLVITEGEQA